MSKRRRRLACASIPVLAGGATLSLIVATVVALASPSAAARSGDHRRCDRDVDAAFDDVEATLRRLGDDLDRVDNRRDRQRLREDMAAMTRAVERARRTACEEARPERPTPPPVVIAPPPPRVIPVMDQGTYSALQAAVDDASFADQQLNVVRTALSSPVCVTTAQARGLITIPSFSQGKLDMAAMLIPRIVDREAGFTLVDAVTFASDKTALNAQLQTTPTDPMCLP